MKKQNCWEYNQCGREVGGANTQELGVCPAAIEERTHGINGGTNGGRACWAITGTFCDGNVQGRFGSKVESCVLCDFYKKICQEENVNFKGAAIILDILRKHPANEE